MKRLRGFGVAGVLALAALFGLGGGQALAAQVSCGEVITQDTRVDNDLINCPVNGLVIGADDVTLDLNGHTIDGTGSGIGVVGENGDAFGSKGPDAVTIENGTIREFSNGILLYGATGSHLARLSVTGSIHLEHSPNALIEKSEVDGYIAVSYGAFARIEANRVSGGIQLGSSGAGVIARNHVSGGAIRIGEESSDLVEDNVVSHAPGPGIFLGSGIFLTSAGDTVVVRNRVTAGGGPGVQVNPSFGANEIKENVISDNAGIGIRLDHSLAEKISPDRVERNVVYNNSDGIFDNDDGGSLLSENRIYGNRASGIIVGNLSLRFQVVKNRVWANGRNGIFVWQGGVFSGLIEGNSVTRNGGNGIDDQTPGNTVTDNRAIKNVDFGIEAVPGVIDGGGNRAFGNGNPLQCLNVVCK